MEELKAHVKDVLKKEEEIENDLISLKEDIYKLRMDLYKVDIAGLRESVLRLGNMLDIQTGVLKSIGSTYAKKSNS